MLAYIRLLGKDFWLTLYPLRGQSGRSRRKALGMQIGFGLLALTLYGSLATLEYFLFQGFLLLGNPRGILAAVFLFCVILTLFTSFLHVFHALFFSRDIAFVSALPISSRGILTAKMVMVLLSEAGLALLICLPAMVLFGVHTGAGILYYAKALLFVPLLPIAPLALVMALAFGLIRVSALWKRREGVTTVAVFLLMVGTIAGQMFLSGYMQRQGSRELLLALLFQRFDMVELLAAFYPPLRWLCGVFFTPGAGGWLQGLWIWLASAGLLGLAIYGRGGGYQLLAVRQSEARARLNARGKRRGRGRDNRPPFWALYLRELREILTVPAYAANCLAPLVMFPVLLLAGAGSMGARSAELFLLRSALAGMPRWMYLAIAGAALSLTGSMNMAVSTAASREGKRHAFSRILPVMPGTQLFAKLAMGLTLNLITAVLSAVTLCYLLPGLWRETLLALPIAGLYSVMACTLGLGLDACRPYYHWKSETEAVKRSVNGALSLLIALVALGLLVGLYLLLGSFGLPHTWNLAVSLITLAAADALLLLWLKGPVAAAYYLQERFN